MVRLWTDGAEYGTLHTQLYSAISGTPPTNDTTAPPDGAYEYRCDFGESARKDVYAANATRILYWHSKFTLVTSVDVSSPVLDINPSGTNELAVFLNTDDTLQMYAKSIGVWSAQGGASAALIAGTPYRLEWKVDSINNAIAFKIDGTDIAGDQGIGIGDIGGSSRGITFGCDVAGAGATAGQVRMDSLAINDDTGSFQNTWIGEQSVIHIYPSAAGDNTAWTPLAGSNWDNVEEVPADDDTTYNSEATLNDIDDYNYAATGLPADEVIDVLHVTSRWRVTLFIGASKHVVRIKASPGGTVEESAELPVLTAYGMLNGNTEPKLYPLTLYDLPGASTTAWTPADLDAAQAGVRCSFGGGAATRVTTLPIVIGHHGEMRLFQQASEPLRRPVEIVAY